MVARVRPSAFIAMIAFLAWGCGGSDAPPADASADAVDFDASPPEPPFGIDWDMPSAEQGTAPFRAIVANVGNIDLLRCSNVAFNLCGVETEEAVATRIAALAPDLVLLQEILTPAQCEALGDEARASLGEDHLCHPSNASADHQARRLLGPDFTIACDARAGYECIGLRSARGTLHGCDDGALCEGGARVAPPGEGCDPGFSVSAVTLTIDDTTLDVVNAHPPSGDGEASVACRLGQLEHALEPPGAEGALREHALTLAAGDFNFDPWRGDPESADVAYWTDRVSPRFDEPEGTFAYHSGIVEHDPPHYTSILPRTLDHAVSAGLIGRCVTMGAVSEGDRIDAGGSSVAIERLDHLALLCELAFPAE
jgi:hypothetical protein